MRHRAAKSRPWVVGGRVLSLVSVVLAVSLLTFVTVSVLPGDVAAQLLGPDAKPEQIAQLREDLGVQGSSWQNYGNWIRRLAVGDLGRSLTSGVSVMTLLRDRAPVTLQLLSFSLLVALGLAFPAALLGAWRPRGLADKFCNILSMVTISAPNYIFALILVFVFAIKLPLFPAIGFTPLNEGLLDNLRSLTLPSLAIALPLFGMYAQFLRNDLLEQMSRKTYVIAAAARGLGRWSVLINHALRNAVFGVLAILGTHVGTLLGGTVIIEQIFALPGLGQLLLHAVHTRDVVVIQGIVLLFATVTVLTTYAIESIYAGLDPRVRSIAG